MNGERLAMPAALAGARAQWRERWRAFAPRERRVLGVAAVLHGGSSGHDSGTTRSTNTLARSSAPRWPASHGRCTAAIHAGWPAAARGATAR